MRLVIVSLFCFLFSYYSLAKSRNLNELFNPVINTKVHDELGLALQIWDIKQDYAGNFYYATQQGVVKYNGYATKLFKLPLNSATRSIALSENGDIYVGATDEFGILKVSDSACYTYVSLSDSLNNKQIGAVYNTEIIDDHVYFITNQNKVFEYFNNRISELTHLPVKEFRAFNINNKLYFFSATDGIWYYSNNKFSVINLLFSKKVYSAIYYSENQILVGTLNNGLFLLDIKLKNIRPLDLNVNSELKNKGIYSLLKLHNNNIAIATLKNGLYILNSSTIKLSSINIKQGLLNNSCFCLYQDLHSDLWLGHETGTSQIEMNAPYSVISPNSGIEGSYRDIISYNNALYIATSSGIYSSNKNFAKQPADFVNLNRDYIYGLDFCVLPINNYDSLLIASTLREIIWIKPNDKIEPLFDLYACHSIKNSYKYKNRFYAGGEFGIMAMDFKYENGNLTIINAKSLRNFTDHVRDIEITKDEIIWIRTSLNQIFRISIDSLADISTIKEYKPKGIDNNVEFILTGLVKKDDDIYVTSSIGLFKINEANSMEHVGVCEMLTGNNHLKNKNIYIQSIQSDSCNNLFVSTPNEFLQLDCNDSILNKNNFKTLNEPVQYIKYLPDIGVCALGQKNLYLLKNNFPNITDFPFSLVFEQFLVNESSYLNFSVPQSNYKIKEILANNKNNISIIYSAPFYRKSNAMMYSSKLEGFDSEWGAFNKQSHRTYTNLSGGAYVFKIKAKNIYGDESDISEFHFNISKPWYKSIFFILICIVFGVSLITSWIFMFYNSKKNKIRQSESNKQIRNIYSELSGLPNDSYESDLDKLMRIFNSTNEAMAIVDESGDIEWVNDGYVNIYGYKLYEILLNEVKVLGNNKNSIIKAAINEWETQKKPYTITIEKETKSNGLIQVNSTLTPIIKDGKLQRVLIVDKQFE